jgi:hypothetical protein
MTDAVARCIASFPAKSVQKMAPNMLHTRPTRSLISVVVIGPGRHLIITGTGSLVISPLTRSQASGRSILGEQSIPLTCIQFKLSSLVHSFWGFGFNPRGSLG